MESLLPLLVQLVSGAAGGNAAGAAMKKLSLGTVGNSIAGVLGGGIGGQLLGMLGMGWGAGDMDMGGIVGSLASGGVGGGALMAVIGTIKNQMTKS